MFDTPRPIRFAARFAIAVAVTACSPYDPNLGEAPFRCGTMEPICPDGYECVNVGDPWPTGGCVKTGGDAPDNPGDSADADPFCNNDDSVETSTRNDTIDTATPSGIPDFQNVFSLADLAICPGTDVDVYRLRNSVTASNIIVALQTDRGVGDLALEILNGTGRVIATGTYTDNANMTVMLSNAPTGTYFVQVRSQSGAQNNYTAFTITLADP